MVTFFFFFALGSGPYGMQGKNLGWPCAGQAPSPLYYCSGSDVVTILNVSTTLFLINISAQACHVNTILSEFSTICPLILFSYIIVIFLKLILPLS